MDYSPMHISVIIVTFESYEIATVLDVLLAQLSSGDEVIVVDDHSSKRAKTILETYARSGSISLYESLNPGNRPANRNLGASHAKNDIFVFVDGDVVLSENTIAAFKEAYATRSEVAFIGCIHGGHYDEPALRLFLGESEYASLVKTPEGRNTLLANPLIRDRREELLEELAGSKYFWSVYYSTYCSVTRSVFYDIGGFEERCVLWGGEDVDLGYEISLRGDIGFLPRAHGFHIPHPRDIIQNDRTNAANFKMLYRKHPVWEFEVLASYRIAPLLLQAFEQIRSSMSLVDLHDATSDVLHADSVAIEAISRQNPRGRITYMEEDGSRFVAEAMGLVIHAPNKAYGSSYVSDNVFAYPPAVAARILQEARRISNETFLVCSGDKTRLDWRDLPRMKNFRPLVRTEYASSDTMDYRYVDMGTLIKVEELF